MSELLLSWLGSGGNAVSPELSEKRAQCCINCDNNTDPLWWEKALKDPVADAIRKTLEIKNGMKISTSVDKYLHICSVCRCCNPLKVHVPIETIKEHTKPEVMKEFPSWCWIFRESKSL